MCRVKGKILRFVVEIMESVSLYSEARNEYLKQMSTWIVPSIVDFFRTNYSEITSTQGKKTMTAFQAWCSEIPKWNQDIIEKNIENILESCNCDYIEELMTAVFIAHTKMLTAVRISSKQKKLQITLPKLDHFLHRVFVECARIFWKAPYLFLEELQPIEKQKNILQAESLCTEALSAAVRSLLPIKSILRDYLQEDEGEEETVSVSSVSKKKSKKSKKEESDSSDSDSDSTDSNVSEVEKELEHPILETEPIANIQSEDTKVFKKPKQEPIAEKVEQGMVLEKIDAVPYKKVVQTGGDTSVDSLSYLDLESIVDATASLAPASLNPASLAPASLNTASLAPASLNPASLAPASLAPASLAPASLAPASLASEEIKIDTEPSVRFSDYETVFDETKPNISEIRYAPKMSIEEMPDVQDDDMSYIPKLQVSTDVGSAIEIDDIEDLEPVKNPLPLPIPTPVNSEPQYVDAPLSSIGDEFEELA